MTKIVCILTSILLATASIAQDSSIIRLNTVSLNYGFLLQPTRNFQLPISVYNGAFYQKHFGNIGVPERTVYKQTDAFQIGINTGFELTGLKKFINHEIILGLGFQINDNFNDAVTKRNTAADSSGYRIDELVAQVRMIHSSNELFFNAAWLFKTNFKKFNFFTGVGTNLSYSTSEITALEIEKDVLINQYSFKDKPRFHKLIYFPVGFELSILNKYNSGLVIGFQTLIRYDNRVSSGFNLSIGRKL